LNEVISSESEGADVQMIDREYFATPKKDNPMMAFLEHTLGGHDLITADGKSLPVIYIGPKLTPSVLIIYQIGQITVSFLVDMPDEQSKTKDKLDAEFCKNLGKFISHRMTFAPTLEDLYNRRQGFEEEYRYIYFNHINLALKTSLKEKGAMISRDTMGILNTIHSDFEKSTDNISEVIIRTADDRWIVGRKSEQREFFVIFDNARGTSTHLIDINEQVRKLSQTYFNNIFID